MGTAYYYSRNAQRFGPVEADKLRELASSGQLQPTDLIWKEGMADWVPAARLKGLQFTAAPVQSAPVAQPAPTPQPAAASPGAAGHGDEFRVAELPPRPTPVPEPSHSRQDERAAAVEADYQADMARKAKEAALAASTDALAAFKIMAKNPVGGLRAAFEHLGQTRAMTVGIVFGIVFDLCILIGLRLLMVPLFAFASAATRGMQAHFQFGFLDYIKLLILGLVPPLCATGGCALARTIFKGRGNIQSDIFIAGAALLPWGLATLLSGILGPLSYQLIEILMVIAMTTTVLMLYSGCTKLQEIPEAAATLAVPLMIAVDLLACQVILQWM